MIPFPDKNYSVAAITRVAGAVGGTGMTTKEAYIRYCTNDYSRR